MAGFLDVAVTYTPRLSAKEQQLLSFSDRLRNLAPLMTQVIAPEAADVIQRHWDTKGAAFGHPWAELAPSTVASRIRKGTLAKGILRDTEELERSLFASIRSARRLQRTAGGFRLSLAPDDPEQRKKFGFLMRGTRLMPVRQPVPSPLPRSFRDRMRALTRDYLLTGRVRGAGGQFVAGGAS